jgi:Ca2+-binding RTX toxin-like protein
VVGDAGADIMFGQNGADTLVGLGGNDLLCLAPTSCPGGDGDDTLDGGRGKGRLDGAPGADRLTGEPGKGHGKRSAAGVDPRRGVASRRQSTRSER